MPRPKRSGHAGPGRPPGVNSPQAVIGTGDAELDTEPARIARARAEALEEVSAEVDDVYLRVPATRSGHSSESDSRSARVVRFQGGSSYETPVPRRSARSGGGRSVSSGGRSVSSAEVSERTERRYRQNLKDGVAQRWTEFVAEEIDHAVNELGVSRKEAVVLVMEGMNAATSVETIGVLRDRYECRTSIVSAVKYARENVGVDLVTRAVSQTYSNTGTLLFFDSLRQASSLLNVSVGTMVNGRNWAMTLAPGAARPSWDHVTRGVSDRDVIRMWNFLDDNSRPSATRTKTARSRDWSTKKEVQTVRYLLGTKSALYEAYAKYCAQKVRRAVSKSFFMQRVHYSAFSVQKAQGGLCYVCSDNGYQVIEDLLKLANDSGRKIDASIVNKVKCWISHVRGAIAETCRELKCDLAGKGAIVVPEDNCLTHDWKHAFRCGDEVPTFECDDCDAPLALLDALSEYVNSLGQFDGRKKLLSTAVGRLITFMGHLMRHQTSRARFEAKLAALDENHAIIIVDFKNKILSKKANERTVDYYAKRGWSYHCLAVIYVEDGERKIQYHDCWSSDSVQDWYWVVSALDVVFGLLSDKNAPDGVKCLDGMKVSMFCDNGTHYHNAGLVFFLREVGLRYAFEIDELNFWEVQEGKTSEVDGHFGHVSHAYNDYINAGGDMGTGEEMEHALTKLSATFLYRLEIDRVGTKFRWQEAVVKGRVQLANSACRIVFDGDKTVMFNNQTDSCPSQILDVDAFQAVLVPLEGETGDSDGQSERGMGRNATGAVLTPTRAGPSHRAPSSRKHKANVRVNLEGEFEALQVTAGKKKATKRQSKKKPVRSTTTSRQGVWLMIMRSILRMLRRKLMRLQVLQDHEICRSCHTRIATRVASLIANGRMVATGLGCYVVSVNSAAFAFRVKAMPIVWLPLMIMIKTVIARATGQERGQIDWVILWTKMMTILTTRNCIPVANLVMVLIGKMIWALNQMILNPKNVLALREETMVETGVAQW